MNKENEIYKLLEGELYDGIFENGDKFYSENQLVIKYKISRLTARNVLKKMEKANFIKSKKAVGYFVNEKIFWNKGTSWNKKTDGVRNSEVEFLKVDLDDFFKIKFNLDPKEFYSFLKKRLNNGLVYSYSIIWINRKLVGELNKDSWNISTLDILKSKNEFDCSLNIIKMCKETSLDKKILEIDTNGFIPIKYSIIQNTDFEFIQLSIEKYNPLFFEHNFIQNL
ncbi:hypothetical protein SHELI_v1c09770 [Spiroplasma helicoides]|uniref:HTH gntR-type domain-containing protein n=1 Tax=Spiroplasma helicoides TaxID=216938 RepID=A0A1B3SLW9_9MOLU|nr:GntR family transcriptional regulator [Spiroplasma helicoides]AOG60924.1 hypothetical protein SHELI_v1c09770 [Spiroplasma helicoides]